MKKLFLSALMLTGIVAMAQEPTKETPAKTQTTKTEEPAKITPAAGTTTTTTTEKKEIKATKPAQVTTQPAAEPKKIETAKTAEPKKADPAKKS
jgi:hypothetical protein